MRVLVTGARSQLGGAVAAALVGRGDTVRVLQRRPSGLQRVDERLGDVADPDTVRSATEGVDAVVHLAARVSVTGPWREFERVNVGGTRTVLDAARAAGVGRVVHVSSPSVAHTGRALVAAPAGSPRPDAVRGCYARSKARAELLALAADGPGLAVVAIRPHLVWGPGDTQLVGRVVSRARAGRLALVGAGAALVDSTYVDDAADALVAALDAAPDVHGRAYVVSAGDPRTVRELVERLCRAAGVPPPRLRVPIATAVTAGAACEGAWAVLRRSDDPPLTRFLAEQLSTAHWFDQRRTRADLGWAPRVGLDAGFERLASAYSAGAGAGAGAGGRVT